MLRCALLDGTPAMSAQGPMTFHLTFPLPFLVPCCLCSAVIHGIVAWLDAYGIGANDVANAFGTSVGKWKLRCLTALLGCWQPSARFSALHHSAELMLLSHLLPTIHLTRP